MKSILGKAFILLFFSLVTYLNAAQLASHTLTANNNYPFVKEAVKLTFVAKQTDHSNVMFFFLEPKKSDNYKIVLLNKNAKEISYHNKETTFTYLLFPLKSGILSVNFNYTIKVASDDAVAEVFKGSRDNVKWIETIDKKIELTPFILRVKEIKEKVALIGNFKLSSKLQSSSINSYESANITYYLQGTGYDDINLSIITALNNVKIFSDIVKHYNKASNNGFKIQREFKYALVSNKSFQIPSKEIRCFNPKNNKYYTLKSESYFIQVTPVDKGSLVDNENYPKKSDNSSFLEEYLIYLVIFISGFISAKIMPNKIKFLKKEDKYDDIIKSNSAKDLLTILLNRYETKLFSQEIGQLEEIIYHKKRDNFKKIKKSILKTLQG